MEEKRKIVHAALRSPHGFIFIGKSHADCFRKAKSCGIKIDAKACSQGFMTNGGLFLDREKAFEVAFRAGQVKGHEGRPFIRRYDVRILFSEDLWCERDGGIHEYSETEGYYLRK